MKITSDPTGGPQVIVDTSEAVIPQHADSSILLFDNGDQVLALELEGPQVGGGVEARSDVLYLLDGGMAARLCSQLVGIVAQSAGDPLASEFYSQLDASLAALRAQAEHTDGGS